LEEGRFTPKQGFLKRWSMIWVIPVIICGGMSYYYHSLAQDNREAMAFHKAEQMKLKSSQPPCSESKSRLSDVGECLRYSDAGFANIKAQLAHFEALEENESSLSRNKRDHERFFSLFALFSAIFLAPHVIWLLLILGRWIWSGSE
jgi:hypothetical protein